jgi:hypothetical protein
LSTSGNDRSEKQDRAKVGDHGKSDDPGPTAFLHARMMLLVGISTQAARGREILLVRG